MSIVIQQALDGKEQPVGFTAKDIVRILVDKYARRQSDKWLVIPELRVGTGYGADAEQRIDLWVMALWPSEHFARTAFEVKISRSDFLSELKKPAKRRRALLLSNQFYFVAPAGLIRTEEVPIECGLMEIAPDGYEDIKVAAPWRDAPAPTWRFLASLARRLRDEKVGQQA